jgi:hypothetical protein
MRTFVLRIAEPAAGTATFPVELLRSENGEPGTFAAVPGGSADMPLALPLGAAMNDPDGKPLSAGGARSLYDASAEPSDNFGLVGEFLFRLLTQGGLDEAWAPWRREAQPTRTLLDIADGAQCRALHPLPWECMYDALHGAHAFLDLSHVVSRGKALSVEDDNPHVRPSARAHRFPLDDWPLRVLVIFGAAPEADDGNRSAASTIGADRELEALETLFAKERFGVDCEVLEHPDLDTIAAKMKEIQPHILHFIGHAAGGPNSSTHCLKIWRPDPAPGADTAEVIDGLRGTYLDWALPDIRNHLQAVKPPCLAFLNACRTSAAAVATNSPFASIADAFLNLGTLAVLGMQGNVPGDRAAEFAKCFYESVLEKGQAVDEAAASARWTISKRCSVARSKAWSFPLLRTRVLPALVLPRPVPPPPSQVRLLERFVAQVPQRRIVRDALRAPASLLLPGGSRHLVAIVGQQGAGKTHLAKWSAQMCARGERRTAYVDFGENESLDSVDALRRMRDGDPQQNGTARVATLAPVTEPAKRRFTWELNHRLQGVTLVPDLSDEQPVVDDARRLAGSAPDESFIPGIFLQFRLALEKSAEPDGLLLVLDQLSTIQEAHLKLVAEHLLSPIAAGQVKGVCAIVVARTDGFHEGLSALRNIEPKVTVVELGELHMSEFERVGRHLAQQWAPSAERYRDYSGKLRSFLRDLSPTVVNQERRFKAAALRRVEYYCKAVFGDP